jgi:hypothetical protein
MTRIGPKRAGALRECPVMCARAPYEGAPLSTQHEAYPSIETLAQSLYASLKRVESIPTVTVQG